MVQPSWPSLRLSSSGVDFLGGRSGAGASRQRSGARGARATRSGAIEGSRHYRGPDAAPDGSRPAGTYARQVLGRLLIDLSWASSRLEGNTYSRLDTQNLIEFGRVATGKDPTGIPQLIEESQVRQRRLGYAKAAELAHMPQAAFVQVLGTHRISPFDLDEDELEREIGAGEAIGRA